MLDQLEGEVDLDQIDATSINYWKMRCKTQLDNLLLVYYKKFKELLPEPQLVFDLESRTIAGQAVYPNKIRINLKFLLQEREHYIANVVGHELAHYIVFHFIERKLIKSRSVKPHGAEWRALMYLFGIEPNVYHSYDVEPREGTLRYLCNCKVHWLTKIRHNRCQNGTQYYCKKCGALIKYQPDPKVQPGEQENQLYKKVRKAQVPRDNPEHKPNLALSPSKEQEQQLGQDASTIHQVTGEYPAVSEGQAQTAQTRTAVPRQTCLNERDNPAGTSAAVIPSTTDLEDLFAPQAKASAREQHQAVRTQHGFTMPLAKGVKLLKPQGVVPQSESANSQAHEVASGPQSTARNAQARGVSEQDQGRYKSATDDAMLATPHQSSSPPSAYRCQQRQQALRALEDQDTFLGYLQATGVASLSSQAKQKVRERRSPRSKKPE